MGVASGLDVSVVCDGGAKGMMMEALGERL